MSKVSIYEIANYSGFISHCQGFMHLLNNIFKNKIIMNYKMIYTLDQILIYILKSQ
jgi:hypothetical protein